MNLYGAAQSGGSLTGVLPGEKIALFDGSETPGANVGSLAFVRLPGVTGEPSPIVFSLHFPSSPTAVVQIQGSNVDADADYQALETFTNLQDGYYQDAGNFTFYRAVLASYAAGGMPIVMAQR